MTRSLATIALLVLASAALVAAQASQPAAPPRVGQDGKDVEWVPTPDDTASTMLDLAKVRAGDTVIDLGSGDGKLVIAAAQRGANGIGVEYDANLVSLSIDRAAKAGVATRTTFVKADLFEVDLSGATVITMFLLPDLNLRLRPRLLQLKPGTRIVSNTWDMEEWTPDETARLDCPQFCHSLLWIVPARVEGTWTSQDGALNLSQQFQMVTGDYALGGMRVPITNGRLRGDALVFDAGGTRFAGRVAESSISGTMTPATGRARPWTATRQSSPARAAR